MSYGLPSKEPARRGPAKSGGGIVFVLILGFVAYMFFSNMGSRPQTGPELESQSQHGKSGIRKGTAGGLEPKSMPGEGGKSNAMPTTGNSGAAPGWSGSVEESVRNPKEVGGSDGWSGVEMKGRKQEAGVELKFSNQQDPGNSGWSAKEVENKANEGWSHGEVKK